MRHVVGSQRDNIGAAALELSGQYKLVFLCILLGYGLGGVVELVETVFVSQRLHAFLLEIIAQIFAEGLGRRQEYAAIVDRIALHKVELPVGMDFHIGIQSVQSHHLQQRGLLQRLLGQVGEIGAGGVALVFDVHAKPVLLYLRCQIVHVFHHQPPVGLRGVVRRILQGLHKQAFVGLSQVGRKLTHLKRLAAVGIFKGHGQHLVGLQAGLQRDIAQGIVQRVFARCEQTCCRQFLVVHATNNPIECFQFGRNKINGTRGRVDVLHQRRIDIVGLIAGYRHARRRPTAVFQIHALAQFAKGHNVARVRGCTTLVGHPHLQTVNLDTRGDVGQRRHGLVITLAEKL